MFAYKREETGVRITYELLEDGGGCATGVRAQMSVNDKAHDSCEIEQKFQSCAEAEAFMGFLAENGVEPCHLEDVADNYFFGR